MNKHENKQLPWIENHFKLWSLKDMLSLFANNYIMIGESIAMVNILFQQNKIDNYGIDKFIEYLKSLKQQCDVVGLKQSSKHLKRAIEEQPPKSSEAWMIIANTIKDEIEDNLFLFVAPDHALYYRKNNSEVLNESFPRASRELYHAGNCFATGEYTACVFHAMRATEIGLRSFGKYLSIRPAKGIEFSQWAGIINEINGKLKLMRNSKGTKSRNEKLTFCSDAASQFSHFNEAYRKHVSHSRINYEEDQAIEIMDGVQTFLEKIATKIKE